MARWTNCRSETSLHYTDRSLQRGIPRIRDFSAAHELPHHDAVRVHIRFFSVLLMRDDFGCHPAIRSRLGSHERSIGRLNARDTKVCSFDDVIFIEQKVCSLDVSMDDVNLVQVIEAHGDT